METVPKIENESELPQEKADFEEQAPPAMELGVNEYLQKEAERTGEKFPPVYIKFFSGAHGTEYDAGGIPKELEDADIYMPELYGWEEAVAQEFNNVSSGKTSSEDPNRKVAHDFYQPVLKALASSGKPVVFTDLSREEFLSWKEEDDKTGHKMKNLRSRGYKEATEEMKARMKHQADFQAYREKYIREHLGEKVAETLREHPELREKEKVTALITLGVAHTDIYHQLKKTESSMVSRNFSGLPLYGARYEAVRRFMFGKEVSDELAGKMLIEEILETEGCSEKFKSVTNDSLKLIKVGRMFAEIFGGDGKEIFEKWQESESESWKARKEFVRERDLKSVKWPEVRDEFETWRKETGRDTYDFSKYFDTKLVEKGIKIPTTEKELDELLAGKYGAKTAKEL